jgi:hypothetical protein
MMRTSKLEKNPRKLRRRLKGVESNERKSCLRPDWKKSVGKLRGWLEKLKKRHALVRRNANWQRRGARRRSALLKKSETRKGEPRKLSEERKRSGETLSVKGGKMKTEEGWKRRENEKRRRTGKSLNVIVALALDPILKLKSQTGHQEALDELAARTARRKNRALLGVRGVMIVRTARNLKMKTRQDVAPLGPAGRKRRTMKRLRWTRLRKLTQLVRSLLLASSPPPDARLQPTRRPSVKQPLRRLAERPYLQQVRLRRIPSQYARNFVSSRRERLPLELPMPLQPRYLHTTVAEVLDLAVVTKWTSLAE